MHVMNNIATATSKGQLVIPAGIRKRFNIKKGTKFSVAEDGSKIVLQPLTDEYFENMAGILKTKGKLSKILINERAQDQELEDKKN
jgi:AbrB family looped-hinge helix DNA binding protein